MQTCIVGITAHLNNGGSFYCDWINKPKVEKANKVDKAIPEYKICVILVPLCANMGLRCPAERGGLESPPRIYTSKP